MPSVRREGDVYTNGVDEKASFVPRVVKLPSGTHRPLRRRARAMATCKEAKGASES